MPPAIVLDRFSRDHMRSIHTRRIVRIYSVETWARTSVASTGPRATPPQIVRHETESHRPARRVHTESWQSNPVVTRGAMMLEAESRGYGTGRSLGAAFINSQRRRLIAGAAG